MVDKWIAKYMKLAKCLADDNHACYSRKIGVILMSEENEAIGFGYNGSVSGAPHNDDPVYLDYLYETLLDDTEKTFLQEQKMCSTAVEFAAKFGNCRTCPRKLFGYGAGVRLDLCNCAHAERNAIATAAKRGASTKNATMFCWCGVPCFDCASMIKQCGIKKVVCLFTDLPDYSPASRGLLKMGNVELIIVKQEDVMAFVQK